MKVDIEQINKMIDERINRRTVCVYSTPQGNENAQQISILQAQIKKLKEEIKFIKNNKLKGYKKELEDNDFKVEIK
jgi:hypothetical protein